jgi:predicted MPP superfamily phosphohydrolase
MLDRLLHRFDPDFLSRRLLLQVDFITRLFGDGLGGFHLENLDFLFPVLRSGLRLTGLWRRGVRNTLGVVVTQNRLEIAGLPPAFAGLRVLHLSDLHIDVDARYHVALGQRFAAEIRRLEFDLCVMTGDFRFACFGPYHRVHPEIADMMPALTCELGVYGILGNHDFIEQVPYLEQAGVRMLVNEAAPLQRGDQRLWLVGLDDCHFYGAHDFDAALAEVPDDACKVALIHSPELVEEAQTRGIALYLTGHTHGGQLCLPGGFAPYINARCPRDRTRGQWRCGPLVGYTSAGLAPPRSPCTSSGPADPAVPRAPLISPSLGPRGPSQPAVLGASLLGRRITGGEAVSHTPSQEAVAYPSRWRRLRAAGAQSRAARRAGCLGARGPIAAEIRGGRRPGGGGSRGRAPPRARTRPRPSPGRARPAPPIAVPASDRR